MIVIQTELSFSNNGEFSFSADVFATTKDPNAKKEKEDFENFILPIATQDIEDYCAEHTLQDPSKFNEIMADILNFIVKTAKQKNFNLSHIGQKENDLFKTQLEFIRG